MRLTGSRSFWRTRESTIWKPPPKNDLCEKHFRISAIGFSTLTPNEMFSKRLSIIVGIGGIVAHGYAVTLVNDTWQDGTRTDPAAPVYSEDGTDSDGDGDLESAWYFTGTSGTSMTASPGHLITTV